MVALVVTGSSLYAQQQYDDLYYNPDKDRTFIDNYQADKQASNKTYNYQQQESNYDDDNTAYYDDYDYYYSSRIRRFQRPYYGFNFFDPVYVDMSYYDPFYAPGATVLIYDDVFAFNSWYRFNRWNNLGWNRWNAGIGWNSWGYNPYSWNSGWGWNSWNYNPYSYGFNSFGAGFYCPPTWGSGYVYNTVENIRNNTVYSPRYGGSARVPRDNGREIRREITSGGANAPRTLERAPDTDTKPQISPRDARTTDESQLSGRTRAQNERRREIERSNTPSTITPRESAPRRTIETQENQGRMRREESRSWDTGNMGRTNSPARDYNTGSSRTIERSAPSSSGSSSAPRSSGSSRRGGN